MILKVGLIGAGKMGKLRADILSKFPEINIIGYYDVEEKFINLKYFKNIADLYNNVDAVIIGVPHTLTTDYVIEALNRNLHVFSEKPPGTSIENVQQMIMAEQNSHGKKLQFGFNHRYHDTILMANETIKNKLFGDLIWIRGVYGRSDSGGSWRNDKKLAGKGILLSQGIHLVDIISLFLEDISEVKSFVTSKMSETDMETNIFAMFRNEKEQIASLHSSATLWKHTFKIDMGFENGYLSIDGILTGSRSFGNIEKLTFGDNKSGTRGNPTETTYYFNIDYSWERELREFLNCILQDKKVDWGSSEQALKTMEIVERIYENDQ